MAFNDTIRDPMSGSPARFLFTARDNRGIPGTFDYYEGDAGHVFISDIPDDLDRHYADGYQPIPRNEAELAERSRNDAYRLDAIRHLVPGGRFLEIGPWIGLVSYAALKSGYTVSALERDPRCVALMRNVGIDARQTDDPERTLAQSGETYDVIALWHSIEHIPEPWKLIETAARAVRPSGVLVIAAPNPQSAQMRVTGSHWYGLDAPRHLHLISADSYETIGKRCGLITREKTTDDRLGHILERDGWNFELSRRFRGIMGLRSLVRLPLWRLLAKRYRCVGALDGAGFTLVMQRPPS